MNAQRRTAKMALARWMGGADYEDDPKLYMDYAEDVLRHIEKQKAIPYFYTNWDAIDEAIDEASGAFKTRLRKLRELVLDD